jgi:hypothetical protein
MENLQMREIVPLRFFSHEDSSFAVAEGEFLTDGQYRCNLTITGSSGEFGRFVTHGEVFAALTSGASVLTLERVNLPHVNPRPGAHNKFVFRPQVRQYDRLSGSDRTVADLAGRYRYMHLFNGSLYLPRMSSSGLVTKKPVILVVQINLSQNQELTSYTVATEEVWQRLDSKWAQAEDFAFYERWGYFVVRRSHGINGIGKLDLTAHTIQAIIDQEGISAVSILPNPGLLAFVCRPSAQSRKYRIGLLPLAQPKQSSLRFVEFGSSGDLFEPSLFEYDPTADGFLVRLIPRHGISEYYRVHIPTSVLGAVQ